jgi:hypothetical protein
MRTAASGKRLASMSMLAILAIVACDTQISDPIGKAPGVRGSTVLGNGLTLYTDRAEWVTALSNLGATPARYDFTGLTLGRITTSPTLYSNTANTFSLTQDIVAASSFSNSGIDLFADASCSLGTGDCQVFTFNVKDPTASGVDMPTTNSLIASQNLIAWGGYWVQTGVAVGGGTTDVTGPVTLTFGTQSFVLNSYLDANGNGYLYFISNTPNTTLTFTFAKSGTIVNDIFQVYNAEYAFGEASGPTASDMIADLQAAVTAANLKPGITKKLQASLTKALNAVSANDDPTACSAMQDFINAVAKAGKQIPSATAASFTADANDIRSTIGC